MTGLRKAGLCLLAAAMAFCDFEWVGWVPELNGLTPGAEAVVGRPLTPLSYAGVARRTSRRVARRTTYRINTLPAGCAYGPYYGAYYYNCGGIYYVQEGNVYIKVVFE
jgi:hypothetical protein